MKTLFILPVIVVSALSLNAQSAFQASLTPDIAIYPKTTQINGLALSIWGENPQYALALGIVNGSSGESEGFSWAFIADYDDSYTGVAWGLINVSQQKFYGWQDGIINFSQGTFTGLQSGWINVAQQYEGLQLGFVNCAEQLDGVQIGFVNVALNNPWFTDLPDKFATGFPIVNWSF